MQLFDASGRPKIAVDITSITQINLSAGTTSNNLTAVTFSNSNNVSFGLNASTVTASAHINVSAGTTSNNLSAITFSNSPTVSFGLNAGTITASAAGGGGGGNTGSISAGTTRATLGEVVFSNSNGVSFGVDGQTVTASIATSLTNIRVSAGTTSNLLSAVTFSNANGVSFGIDNSTITASIATSLTNIRVSAGTTSNLLSAITFSNANGVSFGIDNSTITASIATSLTNIRVSAGTTSNLLSAITFANSNGVSFGIDASTITASIATQSNQTLGFFATSNTTGESSSSTFDARSVTFHGAGIASVGFSNSSVIISVPAGGGAAGISAGVSTFGHTDGSTGTVSAGPFVLVGTNGLTLSQSTGAAGASATVTFVAPPITLSSFYFPEAPVGMSSSAAPINNNTSGLVAVLPFVVDDYVSAGMLAMAWSFSWITNGTSAGSQTYGHMLGIYSRGTGASSSIISAMASTTLGWSLTQSNNTITVSYPTTTNYTGYGNGSTTSAGLNLTSRFTGMKIVGFPINTLLTPGVYWLGRLHTQSTAAVGAAPGISISVMVFSIQTQLSNMAPMGQLSSSLTTYGLDPNAIGNFYYGRGVWTSAGSVTAIPVSMAFASITNTATALNQMPFFSMWST